MFKIIFYYLFSHNNIPHTRKVITKQVCVYYVWISLGWFIIFITQYFAGLTSPYKYSSHTDPPLAGERNHYHTFRQPASTHQRVTVSDAQIDPLKYVHAHTHTKHTVMTQMRTCMDAHTWNHTHTERENERQRHTEYTLVYKHMHKTWNSIHFHS